MAHANKPIEGEATYWERIIIDPDYDTFFQSSESNDTNYGGTQLHGTDPMHKNYLHFVYGYTLCCGDRKKLFTWLSDKEMQADSKCHVFKKITPYDEAWAVANVVN